MPVRKVASLLADHGVRIVVSNACRSANTSENGPDANMAKMFLEEGISNAVGAMQSEVMSGAATLFNSPNSTVVLWRKARRSLLPCMRLVVSCAKTLRAVLDLEWKYYIARLNRACCVHV